MQPRRDRRIPETRQRVSDCLRGLRAHGDVSQPDDETTESGIRIGSEPECGFATQGSQADVAKSKFKATSRSTPKVATARGGYLKDDALTAWQDVADAYTARTGLPMSADLAAKIAAGAVRKIHARIRAGELKWNTL